ncbi:MAG: serine/threonine-protein kinase, partial [Thermoanaerobaculia bacterium]
MTLAKGDLLGPYEIVAPLGAGGMGEVYRARDTRLGRDVAVKVLPKELAADTGRLRRFEQEARAASALQHPNILVVLDVGTRGDAPYLVTELLEGQTLRERLSTGPLSPRNVLDIAIPVAQGLAAAHEKGIVHRDLKPENLFITRDGFVKILDFGIAKLVMPETEGVSQLPTDMPQTTGSGVILGTVAYMSPEQATGRSVDARSDQFSLGTILYEMLAGRRPFDRETSAETLVAILREDPEGLGILSPGTPPVLTWIVERCLAKDPAERYLSTRDLAHELKAVREHLSRASGPTGTSGAIGAAAAPPRGRRPFDAKIVGALGLAAAVVLGAGFLLGRGGRSPSDQPVFTPLTFRRGIIHRARFAPDGRTVI